MRRFVTSVVLLLFAIPFGVSLSGCHKGNVVTYCNGQNSGVTLGQTTTLDLEPRLTGISLNQAQIGQVNAPSATDCKGTSASAGGVIYASSDITLADVVPATGRLCAGSWNRNTGGGIPDFTTCSSTGRQGTAYITASAQGVVSNPIPVFIHPVVTSIVLGPASTNCALDPASNCALDATKANGCSTAAAPTPYPAYNGTACYSQGQIAQLVARAYQGTNTALPANNISCLVGPLTFTAQNVGIVSIGADLATNGLATAAQPGSTTINASISQASSTAGFFSTCPPASITLSPAGSAAVPSTAISVVQNTAQSLVTTVIDTKGNPITNVNLEYESTSPTTIPSPSNIITPAFPGAASITAVCQPPACNSSPFNEIGLFGNGNPVFSNPLQLNAIGTNINTVLYIGSTNSQYLLPIDFTLPTQATPIRLPYAPNSLVLSEDLSTIYMGTPNEIMIFSTTSNALTKEDASLAGTVLAASPDNTTVVVTDPVRKLVYLYGSTGAVTAEYGGVATHAEWTPDSHTVYITTTDNRLLVYSSFTGWTAVPLSTLATDVAITVPNAGAYLAENTVADVRTICPVTTVSGVGINQTTSNTFYPSLGPVPAAVTRLVATNDGVHILGATTTSFTDITTNKKSGGCPIPFTSAPGPALPLGVAATSLTNLIATSDSAFAFVSYQGTGSAVPQYTQSTIFGTPGTLRDIPLATSTTAPIAPVSEVLSANDQILYVGTSGDNLVHRLARGVNGFADTLPPITPALPAVTGTGTATPDLLAQKPRRSTS